MRGASWESPLFLGPPPDVGAGRQVAGTGSLCPGRHESRGCGLNKPWSQRKTPLIISIEPDKTVTKRHDALILHSCVSFILWLKYSKASICLLCAMTSRIQPFYENIRKKMFNWSVFGSTRACNFVAGFHFRLGHRNLQTIVTQEELMVATPPWTPSVGFGPRCLVSHTRTFVWRSTQGPTRRREPGDTCTGMVGNAWDTQQAEGSRDAVQGQGPRTQGSARASPSAAPLCLQTCLRPCGRGEEQEGTPFSAGTLVFLNFLLSGMPQIAVPLPSPHHTCDLSVPRVN